MHTTFLGFTICLCASAGSHSCRVPRDSGYDLLSGGAGGPRPPASVPKPGLCVVDPSALKMRLPPLPWLHGGRALTLGDRMSLPPPGPIFTAALSLSSALSQPRWHFGEGFLEVPSVYSGASPCLWGVSTDILALVPCARSQGQEGMGLGCRTGWGREVCPLHLHWASLGL